MPDAVGANAGKSTLPLIGGGEMGRYVRETDWSGTPLGAFSTWPQSLRSALSLVLNAKGIAALYWGPEQRLLYNDAYGMALGDRHPWAFGRRMPEVLTDIAPVLGPQVAEVLQTGEGFAIENLPMVMHRNGRDEDTVWTHSFSPVQGETDGFAGVLLLATEMTQQVLADRLRDGAETELRVLAKERDVALTELRLIADALPMLVAFVDTTLTYRFANAAYQEWFGRSPQQVIGRTIPEIAGEAGYAVRRAAIERALAGKPVRMDLDWPWQDRRRRIADIRYLPRHDADGAVDGFYIFVQDVTVLRDAAAVLSARNATLEGEAIDRMTELRLYRDIVLSDAAPILAFDQDRRLIGFNQAHADEFMRVMGHRQEVGEVLPDLFPPEQAEMLRGLMDRALGGERFTVTEEFGDPKRDVPTWEITYTPLCDAAGAVVGAFHHARDISERMRVERERDMLEEQLRQSQKMEAVGQLTGGLAHDFNNLLAGISGSLELMQTRMQQGRFNDVERYMAAAQGASKRAAALTHRLLAFSRRQTLDPKPTDVNRLVGGMQEMIQRTVGPSIPIEVVGASGLWPALVDPSQLENALLNLCINARDAMPDGGRITIETANKWLDERASRKLDMPEGQYLSLCVTDTGTGMPPEVIARVFEPFFTTKAIGEGTGLGLSMIYGFAQQSGGQVRIYSEVGQGTTVCIYLPRYYGEIASDNPAGELAALPRSEQGETVLVVDDEPTVRMLVSDILEDLGYTAIEAGDSAAGLKVLQSDVRIDLLVTDVGLPGGMNGRQMADAAQVTRPDLRVLFITGYAENAVLGNGYLAPGMAVLTKPFTIEAMAARIRSMIEAKRR